MKVNNYACELRDVVADDVLAVGLGVSFVYVVGTTRRKRINASINAERNWL